MTRRGRCRDRRRELLERLGAAVVVEPVATENFKVTTPADLRLAASVLAAR